MAVGSGLVRHLVLSERIFSNSLQKYYPTVQFCCAVGKKVFLWEKISRDNPKKENLNRSGTLGLVCEIML